MKKARRINANPTYVTWQAMLYRCYDNRTNGFHNYGGRGISVCERWKQFENFLQDMGERPSGKQIDRIDVNGNYEPSNCRWVTNQENANNRRNSVWVMLNGERIRLREAANKLGLKPVSVFARWRLLTNKDQDLSELHWRNPYPKFARQIIDAIKSSSLTTSELNRKYGVSRTYIRLLRNGYNPYEATCSA